MKIYPHRYCPIGLRYCASLLICCLLTGGLAAQSLRIAPVGEWTGYLSHKNPRKVVKAWDRYAVVTDGGLYLMDTTDSNYETYTPVTGLAEISPSALYFDTLHQTLFLGYHSGALNFTTDPKKGFKYVSDIKRSEQYTTKGIRDFTSSGDLLYIATEFGIVLYDIVANETRSAVTKVGQTPTGSPVVDLLVFKDSLYASMGKFGLWRVALSHPNITLPDVWTRVDGNSPGLGDGETTFIGSTAGWLYCVKDDSLYRRTVSGTQWSQGPFPVAPYNFVEAMNDFLLMSYFNAFRVRTSNATQYLINTSSKAITAYMDSTVTLVGDTLEGVFRLRQPDSIQYLVPNGPRNNKITALAVGNGSILIAPEGKTGASAPAQNSDGFYYFTQEDGWRGFDRRNGLNTADFLYQDFARALYVKETQQFYVGSWGQGLLELTDGKITHQWTPRNSNLSGSGNIGLPNDFRCGGIAYDRNGVLWAAGFLAEKNLNALDPADSTWKRMHVPGMSPIGIIVDDWNNKWIISQDEGLVVFNENGTLDNLNDDQFKKLSSDPGRGGLVNNSVYAIAKDLRGHIWVGTLEGIMVFANPSAIFTSNFADASCPVIEGFCLLRDQRVTAIAVDGANRKWIGTTNGVYLVNAQGNKLLQHYTTENSPLFENEIRDIVIEPETGEIFIGTSRGLLSLMGDATAGEEDSENLYVYPNPILPDYDGPIAINGSVKDSEVRITTVSGRLVRALNSTGGQTIWDGKDTAGNPLAPGIYLALVTAKDGSGAGIAKFVILSREQ
jgi:hypothetical protein